MDDADLAAVQMENAVWMTNQKRKKAFETQYADHFPVREGEHFLCRNCGEVIPPARLQTLPGVSLCRECTEEEEKARTH